MFINDKITEIFCTSDDFCREFDDDLQKIAIETPKYKGCGKRKLKMITIHILAVYCFFN